MRCPKCASTDDRVIDSRVQRDGVSIRRRRECVACSHRYSTVETIVREGLVVVKRDGRRQDFDRQKIITGLRKACEKRPVQSEQIELLADAVVAELEARGDDEVSSAQIGERIMDKLRRIDKIAYVRYASVYRDFRDVSEFVEAVQRIEQPPS